MGDDVDYSDTLKKYYGKSLTADLLRKVGFQIGVDFPSFTYLGSSDCSLCYYVTNNIRDFIGYLRLE
jgi:hypothetical protein